MKLLKKGLPNVMIVVICAIVTMCLLLLLIKPAQPILKNTHSQSDKYQNTEVQSVALGDSLTQGVGDERQEGGFVPLLANKLEEDFQLKKVNVENFGKAGDRSDQILKRIEDSEEIQTKIRQANLITLTVGGNDLMKVIRQELLNDLSIKSFEKPKQAYQKNLKKLYQEIRKLNPNAPIYQLGIYNPFYLNFPDITEMQDIVDMWNAVSEAVVQDQEHSYFIPINDQLYKGIDGKVGVESLDGEEDEETSEGTESLNNLLSEADRFHPNFLGYQIIAKELNQEIVKTKNEWLTK